jgi:hypothetical protein
MQIYKSGPNIQAMLIQIIAHKYSYVLYIEIKM